MDVVQNMAAHLILVLARGDYDQASDQVIAQIRWCAMFIAQARGLFHPSLRRLLHLTKKPYLHTVCLASSHPPPPVTCRKKADAKQRFWAIKEKKSNISFGSYLSRVLNRLYDDDNDVDASFRPQLSGGFSPFYVEKQLAGSVSDEIFHQLEEKIWARCADDSCELSPPIRQSGELLPEGSLPSSTRSVLSNRALLCQRLANWI